jgi:hypothetical protein
MRCYFSLLFLFTNFIVAAQSSVHCQKAESHSDYFIDGASLGVDSNILLGTNGTITKLDSNGNQWSGKKYFFNNKSIENYQLASIANSTNKIIFEKITDSQLVMYKINKQLNIINSNSILISKYANITKAHEISVNQIWVGYQDSSSEGLIFMDTNLAITKQIKFRSIIDSTYNFPVGIKKILPINNNKFLISGSLHNNYSGLGYLAICDSFFTIQKQIAFGYDTVLKINSNNQWLGGGAINFSSVNDYIPLANGDFIIASGYASANYSYFDSYSYSSQIALLDSNLQFKKYVYFPNGNVSFIKEDSTNNIQCITYGYNALNKNSGLFTIDTNLAVLQSSLYSSLINQNISPSFYNYFINKNKIFMLGNSANTLVAIVIDTISPINCLSDSQSIPQILQPAVTKYHFSFLLDTISSVISNINIADSVMQPQICTCDSILNISFTYYITGNVVHIIPTANSEVLSYSISVSHYA